MVNDVKHAKDVSWSKSMPCRKIRKSLDNLAKSRARVGKAGSGRIKSSGGASGSVKTVDKPNYSKITIDFKNLNNAQVPAKEELKTKYNINVDTEIKEFEPLENDKGKNLGFKMKLEDGTIVEYNNERDLGKFSGSNPTISKDKDGRLLFKGLSGPSNSLKIKGGESLFTFQNCRSFTFQSDDEKADDIVLKNTHRASFNLEGGADKIVSDENSNNRIVKTGGTLSSSGDGENVFIGDFDDNGVDDRYQDKKSANAEKAKMMEKENKHIFRSADFPSK